MPVSAVQDSASQCAGCAFNYKMKDRKILYLLQAMFPRPLTPHPSRLLWALQTEKELDPDGLRKESEREQAILALTATLDKLIKRLQENQSPDLLQKHKKKKTVPQKPPPSPPPTGESRPQEHESCSQRAQP